MPKKPKILTKTLYSYCTPENRAFAIKTAKEKKIPGGYSGYVNGLIDADRKGREKKGRAA